jgi:hypothetical protein
MEKVQFIQTYGRKEKEEDRNLEEEEVKDK